MQPNIHKSVLLHESVDGLNLKAGDIVVDGTLGGGGHSEEIAKRYGDTIKIIGFDLDSDAFTRAELRLKPLTSNYVFVETSFKDIDKALEGKGIKTVNAILLDLGLSSFQLQVSERGFTFQKNEPLEMSFGKKATAFTARDIVNSWAEESIADIIFGYGEERYARRIAKKIVEARVLKPLETTQDLAELIKSAVPTAYRHGKTHPATKTFQALRIAVNDELGALKQVLQKGFEVLEDGGRFAIISFHSLEDRIVKQFFRSKHDEGTAHLINKRVIIPTSEEIKENPRSRSSKLRILQKGSGQE